MEDFDQDSQVDDLLSMSLRVPLMSGLQSRSPRILRTRSRSAPKTQREEAVAKRGCARKRANTVDFGFMNQDFVSVKIAQIQQQFPNDDLHLNESLDAHNFLLGRALSQRRSAPQIVLSKIQEKWLRSSSNLNSEASPSRSSKVLAADDLCSPNVCRSFIHEGAVHLSTSVSSYTRYMFLFTDLLLIAKQKQTASYKLKTRLAVSDLWLKESIDGVTEDVVAADRSFVIGWPTISYVATFTTPEEKTLWWNALKKAVDDQRVFEIGRTVPIRILNKDEDQKNATPLSLPVTNEDDARSVVKMALDGFGLQNSDVNDYQLWVVAGKESGAYPLMGHEIPFCIRMNHMRQSHCNSSSAVSTPVSESEFNLEPTSPKLKCEFILKKKKATRPRLEIESPNSQKRWRSPMKSPIINWALNKKPTKQSPLDQTPLGSLFGLPLSQVAVDNEELPQPIQDMLVELFRRGPSTVGIFRKSALVKSVKQLRQDLDEGKIVSLEDKSSVVIATVFKEFLRVLPVCALGNEFPNELSTIKAIQDPTEKVQEITRLIGKLPKVNQNLVKKFFCALYHISKYSNNNNMTSQNLAICIAPSLVWTKKSLKPSSPLETVSSCEIVEFVIEHFSEIFGEEAIAILGSESDIEQPMSYEDEESSDLSSEVPEPDSPKSLSNEITTPVSLRVPEITTNGSSPDYSGSSPEYGIRTMPAKLKNKSHQRSKPSRRHSENDLTDMNGNFEHQKTGKRFPLESYTTTTELIKHQVNGHTGAKSEDQTVVKVVSSFDDLTSTSNNPRRKKSQNHAYHQKGRPAPTYEEALRSLRQSDRRVSHNSSNASNVSDDKSNSSDENIPSRLTEDLSVSASQRNSFAHEKNSNTARSKPETKLTRQNFVVRKNAHSTYIEPFQINKYTADEGRMRSPDEVFSTSGRFRQPLAPTYQEHLQRRKRFERAYLQQINLDKKDDRLDINKNITSKDDALDVYKNVNRQKDESSAERKDFTRASSVSPVSRSTYDSDDSLSWSLDSSGYSCMRNRSSSDSCNGIPLSNGVHTFMTQKRRSQSDVPQELSLSIGREAVTLTHSNNARQDTLTSPRGQHPTFRISASSGDSDSSEDKVVSPLRAALNAGSFMYCSDGSKGDVFSRSLSPNAKLSTEPKCNMKFNTRSIWNSSYPSSQEKQDLTKAAEDFDKILSNLRNYDAESDSSSANSDSACELDIPSHEDIQNILCQDESYV